MSEKPKSRPVSSYYQLEYNPHKLAAADARSYENESQLRHRSSSLSHVIGSAPRRRRFSSIFNRRVESSDETRIKFPDHFYELYDALDRGLRLRVTMVTDEQSSMGKKRQQMNAAQLYEHDKKVKHLERMKQKLEFQLTQLEELHDRYKMQMRYKEGGIEVSKNGQKSEQGQFSGADKLKTAISVTSTTELIQIEKMLEDEVLGCFHFQMKGLLGYARLKSGDHYEMMLRHGTQKWRSRGTVKSSGLDQKWENSETVIKTLVSHNIHIKIDEMKLFGKRSTIGELCLEVKKIFTEQDSLFQLNLNDAATIKLHLDIQWSPFEDFSLKPRERANSLSPATISGPATVETPIQFHSAQAIGVKNTSSYQRHSLGSVAQRLRPIRMTSPTNHNSSFFTWSGRSKKRGLISSGLFNRADTEAKEEIFPNRYPIIQSTPASDEAFFEFFNRNLEIFNNSKELSEDEAPTRNQKSDIFSQMSDFEKQKCCKLAKLSSRINTILEDFRGRYEDLKVLELSEFELQQALQMQTEKKSDDVINYSSISDEVESDEEQMATTGQSCCDEALIRHLQIAIDSLEKIGVFGPLRVIEDRALDCLCKQGHIIRSILKLAQTPDVGYEGVEQLMKNRALLEFWKSCCSGSFALTTSGKILRLELEMGYGSETRIRHAEVATRILPELVRRIAQLPEGSSSSEVDQQTVTVFQLHDYVTNALETGDAADLGKLIDLLGYEIFISSELRNNNSLLVLRAIKQLSSLLAMTVSNLRALTSLLLASNKQLRNAAAAHIRHLGAEEILREKAINSFAELLESREADDRKSSCIAIGFIGAHQLIPQLAFLLQTDEDPFVRQAASHVLLSFGDEGERALQEAESSFLTQTMTQQVSMKRPARIGTSL